MRWALIAVISLNLCSSSFAAQVKETWMKFNDRPTQLMHVKKGYRVIFSHHAGVYYLLKSDQGFEANLKKLRDAEKESAYVEVEAEATYLNIRSVTPAPAPDRNHQ